VKIRRNDNVLIIAGKSRGKQGVVQKAMPGEDKVIVTGVNIAKHHLKPSRKNPHGGIIDMAAPINVSNVILICPHCNQPTRVAYKQSGQVKERICRKCQGNLNTAETPQTTVKVKEKNVKA
jgi:large subunit ribosomal protein L24